MDNETFQQITTLADSLTTIGLLLYFVFYFKQKAEVSNSDYIQHLKEDVLRKETDKTA